MAKVIIFIKKSNEKQPDLFSCFTPPLFQFTDYQYIKNKYRMIPNNGGIRMRDGRRPFLFPIRMYFRVRNRAKKTLPCRCIRLAINEKERCTVSYLETVRMRGLRIPPTVVRGGPRAGISIRGTARLTLIAAPCRIGKYGRRRNEKYIFFSTRPSRFFHWRQKRIPPNTGSP